MGGGESKCLLSTLLLRCNVCAIANGEIGMNFIRRKSPIAKMNIHIRMPFVMLERTSFSPADVACITSDDAEPIDQIR